MSLKEIYTVGHSNHQIDYFLELIKFKEINCIVDVRSTPASSYSPQFNKVPLKNYLKNNVALLICTSKMNLAQDTSRKLS